MVDTKCDLCGSDDSKLKFEIDISERNMRFYRYSRNIPNKDSMTGVHRIVQCSNCNLVYTNPRFSTDQLELVYSSDKILGGNWQHFMYLFNSALPDEMQGLKRDNSYSESLYQWKFDIIDNYQPKGEKKLRLIDIGCGDGKFVHDAIQRGYDAIGVDLSPDRIERGKKLYNLGDDVLRCMNIDEFSEDDKFDIIVMWDVIEHVESPSGLLKSLHNISHKNSKLFALTMSMDSITYKLYKKNWYYINPSQHLNYFSHKTIERMYEENGFKFLGAEMDDSRSQGNINLIVRIVLGLINQFFFHIYKGSNPIKYLFKPFQRGISNERMKKRLENLHPGRYYGRFHDNFVFIGQLKDE